MIKTVIEIQPICHKSTVVFYHASVGNINLSEISSHTNHSYSIVLTDAVCYVDNLIYIPEMVLSQDINDISENLLFMMNNELHVSLLFSSRKPLLG